MFENDCLDQCAVLDVLHACVYIFVFVSVWRSWAHFTWKGALEIQLLLLSYQYQKKQKSSKICSFLNISVSTTACLSWFMSLYICVSTHACWSVFLFLLYIQSSEHKSSPVSLHLFASVYLTWISFCLSFSVFLFCASTNVGLHPTIFFSLHMCV